MRNMKNDRTTIAVLLVKLMKMLVKSAKLCFIHVVYYLGEALLTLSFQTVKCRNKCVAYFWLTNKLEYDIFLVHSTG